MNRSLRIPLGALLAFSLALPAFAATWPESEDGAASAGFTEEGMEELDQLIDRVAEIPLLFEPGEEWFYSVAVDIQGYIVQKLSGMRFGEFLEQRMFQPLGMNDTRFYVREQDRPRFAEVHDRDAERGALVQRPHRADRPSHLDPTRLESGGGLVSSTRDYARFPQMLVNEGEKVSATPLAPG